MSHLPARLSEFHALLAILVLGCSSPSDPEPDGASGPGGSAGSSGTGGSSPGAGGSAGSSAGGTAGTGGAAHMPGAWVNVTADLAGMSSVCGNTYRIWAHPSEDRVFVAVVRVGIYASTDGGASWVLQGGSTSPNHDHNGMTFDPEHSEVYWAAGMHANPGVFKTTDNGASFAVLGSITNIDDISVDFTDPERKTILAGAHEQHLLYKSTDGGASFSDIAAAFPPGSAFTFAPLVVDANVLLMGTAFYNPDASEGVFRSSDGGASWTQVSTQSVGGAGLKTSWGPLFYASKAGNAVLRGSADGATWTSLPVAGGRGYTIVIELPGNRIATTARNGTVNSIVMSVDDGESWTTIADNIPAPVWWNSWVGPHLAYNSARGAFFVSYYDCGETVHPDSVWRYDTTLE